jgi:hypothetical protein
MDEQMALLGFEVLEKTHVEVPQEGPMTTTSLKLDEEEDTRRPQATKEQIQRSLDVFRSWLAKRMRWQWFDRIKRWDKKQIGVAITAVVGVLAVGIVVLNIGLGRGRQLDELEGKLTVAQENVTQAATRGAFDKTEADLLLAEAETLSIEVLNSGYLGGQASQLLDDIEEQRDFLDNVVRIDDELVMLADLSELLGSGEIVGVQPVEDRMVAYTENEAYQILLGDVQEPDVLDNTENVRAGAYFSDRDTVMLITDEGNVMEYEPGNAQFMDTSDGSFQTGVDLGTYSTRIYLLDPENDQIWKYTRGTAGFGFGSEYMVEGEVDLSDAVSMAIDGNVWVLHEDGEISRILSGEDVPYYILKAPLTSIAGATEIYTELDVNQIYVVDPDNDRILTYDKTSKSDDITYGQQYVFDNLKGELTDVYMDKDRDVLIISTTQAIYELGF